MAQHASNQARGIVVKDRLDTRTELRELLVDDLPDELQVNAEIVMDELIAHAGDLPPRQVWVRLREASRKLLHRFADDLEVASTASCVLRSAKNSARPPLVYDPIAAIASRIWSKYARSSFTRPAPR